MQILQSKKARKGQVLIAIAIALFAMFGLLGLTFDMGWSFYLEKTSQLAADAAAMAVALDVLEHGGQLGPYDCTDSPAVFCSATLTPCPGNPTVGNGTDPQDAMASGCAFARRNGFWNGNTNRRQNVRLAADSAGTLGATIVPPAAPGVRVFYWATATVAESTPQMFSAVLGNQVGIVSSSATAAIVDSIITGSLFLLNRENDNPSGFGPMKPGTNLDVQSNSTGLGFSINAGGRIISSSQAAGAGSQGYSIEVNNGNGFVRARDIAIRGTGDYDVPGNQPWQNFFNVEPRNGIDPASKLFLDPTAGKPNPPLPKMDHTGNWYGQAVVTSGGNTNNPALVPPTNAVNYGEPGAGTAANPYRLPPGVYYAYRPGTQNSDPTATGQAIALSGSNTYWSFCTDANCSSFGEYVFVGGLDIGGTNVKYGPGRYVYMGAKVGANNRYALNISSNANVTDGQTAGVRPPDSYAGQIHILAGPDYKWSTNPTDTVANVLNGISNSQVGDLANLVTGISPTVDYAPAKLAAGNTASAQINFHGLQPVPGSDNLPTELEPYRRFSVWQDRENSLFDYNLDGTYPCEPGNTAGACYAPNDDTRVATDTRLEVDGSPNFSLYGVVYQPRGSYFQSGGGGDYTSPIQIVTGAFSLAGNATLDLQNLDFPLVRRVVTLVQ